MDEINRILVVSWITKHCHKSIHYSVSLAEKYSAQLSVIHIVNTLWFQGWNLPMVSILEERKKDLEKVKQDLKRIIDVEKKKGMDIQEFVREGDPVEEILKTIREYAIDLVVMGAHPEGGANRFLVSGSNEAIIRRMPCSVFLVKTELE